MPDPRVCTICGEREPFHVHDGDRRIEDYFTVGRGMSDIEAARAWQARAREAEHASREAASILRRVLPEGEAVIDGERRYYPPVADEVRAEADSWLAAHAAL